MESPHGTLSIVSTPIGNLADISQRAIQCLKEAHLVACEDTRHSGTLFRAHDIQTRRLSLHQHNEASRCIQLLEMLSIGKNIAYISDAGTPLVSDPGARLVHLAGKRGIEVEVIPGPCAAISALAGAGFPADRFYFGGFLSTKKTARTRELQHALDLEVTSVHFESPHRIESTLHLLSSLSPDRQLVVARELTKKFEEFRRGSAQTLAESFQQKRIKGEIVLVISGSRIPSWMKSPHPVTPD
ncbi:MAG: 16S rRNA (cytidine(1402)-2'-O)-methyltransferase [Verrucomicrobiales bacterium]|nr:16S rRNA (cytidine(1402)-2'-O)-methyltransferase [Verrucomicrobiales bacterium]